MVAVKFYHQHQKSPNVILPLNNLYLKRVEQDILGALKRYTAKDTMTIDMGSAEFQEGRGGIGQPGGEGDVDRLGAVVLFCREHRSCLQREAGKSMRFNAVCSFVRTEGE